MITELPTPIMGASHGRVYRLREVPGGSVLLRVELGTMSDGEFQSEEGLRDIEMSAAGVEYRRMMERVQSRGGPAGEFRKSDVVDFVMDPETEAGWRWI